MDIHPKVTAIDVSGLGGIWIFLIRSQKIALIDTGPKRPFPFAMDRFPDREVPPVLQVLPSAMEKMGMTLADIDIILNTHIHFDHTAGNASIIEASKAKLFIHADESGYFERPELLFQRELAPIVEVILGKESLDEEMKKYLEEETGPGPCVPVDDVLRDNDIIELGDGCDLKVVHLPGHSQGSVGFFWAEEGILFAGDAMQGICGHGGGLLILDDPAVFVSSLEHAMNLPMKTMVHSHPFRGLTTPRTLILRDSEISQYLEECQDFMKILKDAVKSIAPDFMRRPFLELYDEIVNMLPEGVGFKKWKNMHRQFFSPATLLNCIRQLNGY